jgi:hypothetical protein
MTGDVEREMTGISTSQCGTVLLLLRMILWQGRKRVCTCERVRESERDIERHRETKRVDVKK